MDTIVILEMLLLEPTVHCDRFGCIQQHRIQHVLVGVPASSLDVILSAFLASTGSSIVPFHPNFIAMIITMLASTIDSVKIDTESFYS